MREVSFIQNGDRPLWLAYDCSNGHIVGEIRPCPTFRFQCYIKGIHGVMIAQGSPHKTLDAAKSDLRDLCS